MLSVDDVLATRSGKAYDSDGDKIGSVGEVYLCLLYTSPSPRDRG